MQGRPDGADERDPKRLRPSTVAKAMCDASKSKAETMIGRLIQQLDTKRTGRANTGAQLDNEWKRARELWLENESTKKQVVESNTKTAEAKQQVEQLFAVMAGNYKKAWALEMRCGKTW